MTSTDLWRCRKSYFGGAGFKLHNRGLIRFLSSQTKPHLDYYNMIFAISVFIFLAGLTSATKRWNMLTSNVLLKLFCVFLFKPIDLTSDDTHFDNILSQYRSLNRYFEDYWGNIIKSREYIVKLHSFRQFVFLPSRNIAFIIIWKVKNLEINDDVTIYSFLVSPRYISAS